MSSKFTNRKRKDKYLKTDCDYCNANLDSNLYSNLLLTHGNFCSSECEMAMIVGIKYLLVGKSCPELISHLRDVHCLTKDQIKIGVDRIFETGNDSLNIALIDWEAYF